MTRDQRQIVFQDAKQHALGVLYHLQNFTHDRAADKANSFRRFHLSHEFGTADNLPPKPYIRESLSGEAVLTVGGPLHEWREGHIDGVMGVAFSPDGKTMAYLAMVEMSHFLNLPNWGYAGTSDSQLPDGQATFEAGLMTYMSMVAGSNLNHDIGYLDFGLTGSLEMIVIMDEVVDQFVKVMPTDYKRVLEEMKKKGITRVRTETDRPETIKWYIEKFGYRVIGKNPKKHIFSDPDIKEWTVLELDLS